PYTSTSLSLDVLAQPDQRHRHLVNRLDHAGLERRRRLAGRASAGVARPASAAVMVVEQVPAGAGVFDQLHAGRITAGAPFESPCRTRWPFPVGRWPFCSPLSLPAPTANGQRQTVNMLTI